MSIAPNPLNDISRVYLESIAEAKVEPPKEKLKTDRNMFNIPKDEQEAARERLLAKSKAKRQAAMEALDPVGKEDADIDNDGDTDKSDKYLHKRRKAISSAMKKRLKEQKELSESHFKVGDEVICKKSGMEGEVIKVDAEEKGKYYTVKREDGKTMKYAPDELKLEDEGEEEEKEDEEKEDMKEAANGGATKKSENKFHLKLDKLVHGTFGPSPEEKMKKKMKESFSNWRQDLSEVMTDEIDSKPIKEKKVNNKVTINPKLGEAVEELGGTLIEMVEIDEFDYVVESVYDELLEEGYEQDDIEDAIEYALTEAKVTFGHDTTKRREDGSMVGAVRRLAKQKLKSLAKKAVVKGARAVASGASKLADRVEGKPAKRDTSYRGQGVGRKEKVGSPAAPAPKASTPKPKATAPKPKAPAAPKAETKAKATSAPKRKKKSKLDSLLADIRNEETQLDEKALSKAQQRFMGMVYATKKGEMEAPSPEVAKAAAGMTKQQAKDFAKTKHKGLPQKKEVKEGATETPMSPQEIALQKRKTMIDQMIAKKRQQALQKQDKV